MTFSADARQRDGRGRPVLLSPWAPSLLCGILFGWSRRFRTHQPNLHDTLKEGVGEQARENRAQEFCCRKWRWPGVLIACGMMTPQLERPLERDHGFDSQPFCRLAWPFAPSRKSHKPRHVRASSGKPKEADRTPGVKGSSLSGSAASVGEETNLFYSNGQPKPASAKRHELGDQLCRTRRVI